MADSYGRMRKGYRKLRMSGFCHFGRPDRSEGQRKEKERRLRTMADSYGRMREGHRTQKISRLVSRESWFWIDQMGSE